jgi:hypothetical protein
VRAGEAQPEADGVADRGELVCVEGAAEGQQLGTFDGDQQEAVEETVGELGGGQVAQQFVFGDVSDDADVRGAGGGCPGRCRSWAAVVSV